MSKHSTISKDELSIVEAVVPKESSGFAFCEYVDEKQVKKKGKPNITRVLAVTSVRIYLLDLDKKKKKADIIAQFNLFDLKAVSTAAVEVTMDFRDKDNTQIVIETKLVDALVTSLKQSIADFAPSLVDSNWEWKLDGGKIIEVRPDSRSCGHFTSAVRAFSDLDGSLNTLRLDILSQIDTLWKDEKVTDFTFDEFDSPLGVSEIKNCFLALGVCSYFKSLVLVNSDDFKFEKYLGYLAQALRVNSSLTSLHFEGINASATDWAVLFSSMHDNDKSGVQSLTLKNCAMDTKVVGAMADWIFGSKMSGLTQYLDILQTSPVAAGALRKLIIGGNKLEKGSESLSTFLSTQNNLQHLDISNTDAVLQNVFDALAQGKTSDLRVLNIAGNKWNKKAETTSMFAFFSSCVLSELNIGDTDFPFPVLEKALLALFNNKGITNLKLVTNKIAFKKEGSDMLKKVIPSASHVSSWDLSESELGEEGIAVVADSLKQLRTITTLDLSYNIHNSSKGKNDATRLNQLIELIKSDCPISHLILKGNKSYHLGGALVPLLEALGSKNNLISLEIGGNQVGDAGALALSKSLQTNDTLRHLSMDQNDVTIKGLSWLKIGLVRNSSLVSFPFPLEDFSSELHKPDVKEEYKNRLIKLQREISDIIAANQKKASAVVMEQQHLEKLSEIQHQVQRENIEKLIVGVKMQGQGQALASLELLRESSNFHTLPKAAENIRKDVLDKYSSIIDIKMEEAVELLTPEFDEITGILQEALIKAVTTNFPSTDSEFKSKLGTLLENLRSNDEELIEALFNDRVRADVKLLADKSFRGMSDLAIDFAYERLVQILAPLAPSQFALSLKKTNSAGLVRASSAKKKEKRVKVKPLKVEKKKEEEAPVSPRSPRGKEREEAKEKKKHDREERDRKKEEEAKRKAAEKEKDSKSKSDETPKNALEVKPEVVEKALDLAAETVEEGPKLAHVTANRAKVAAPRRPPTKKPSPGGPSIAKADQSAPGVEQPAPSSIGASGGGVSFAPTSEESPAVTASDAPAPSVSSPDMRNPNRKSAYRLAPIVSAEPLQAPQPSSAGASPRKSPRALPSSDAPVKAESNPNLNPSPATPSIKPPFGGVAMGMMPPRPTPKPPISQSGGNAPPPAVSGAPPSAAGPSSPNPAPSPGGRGTAPVPLPRPGQPGQPGPRPTPSPVPGTPAPTAGAPPPKPAPFNPSRPSPATGPSVHPSTAPVAGASPGGPVIPRQQSQPKNVGSAAPSTPSRPPWLKKEDGTTQ